jgi:hypothetical protein
MRVSMHPGDNYRVGATVFPTSQLSGMSANTATANGYVSPYTDVVRGGFNGTLSPVLTVWRKLFLEFDSMAAMPTNGSQANFDTGVVRLSQANIPAPGYTRITTLSRLRQYKNAYQNGQLEIAGNPVFTVTANEFNLDYNGVPFHYVYILGNPGTNIIGQTFKLTDDDATAKNNALCTFWGHTD